jgi:nicotinamidase-related amidase
MSFTHVAEEKYALIVIDMQRYFVKRFELDQLPNNKEKLEKLFEQQKKVISYARKQRIPIVFVNYTLVGATNSDLVETATGDLVSIRDSRDIRRKLSSYYPAVQFISKNLDNLFENPEVTKNLESFFLDKGIKNLIMIGANGGACVLSTVIGALNKNYNVIAINSAIADFNNYNFTYPFDFEQYKNSYFYEKHAEQITTLKNIESLDGHIKTKNITNLHTLEHE